MKKIIVSFFITFLLIALNPSYALAAGASMGFSPRSGSFDKPFTINLAVDGHGEKFNAAQATVTVPSNLLIKNLVLGDCNLSFFDTPSIQNPSFKGIILATSSEKCTIYTLTLAPKAKGEAAISLTDANIKRYGDAAEILTTKQNGKYTITGTSSTNSVLGAKDLFTPKSGLYSINLTILSNDNKPVQKATVILSPVSKKDEQKMISDTKGLARFSKLKEGIYKVIVEKEGKNLSETIINVSGPNYTMHLSINVDAQKEILFTNKISPLLIGIILLIGVIIGIAVPILVGRLKRRK